ncbi:MAG: D-alanyl-D-alanine carboxypeptidase [Roseburia sp.]|nr:D-alanyl-D-alanine carboxypeptidase [Roseburia sp.]
MSRGIKWKKIICMMLSALCLLQMQPTEVSAADYWPEGPEVQSPAVILMEMSTGTVLYEKNADEQHYPASITKIMTTLLALENSELDEIVTFSDEAIDNTEGSGISRDYGEQMTMEQCLYAVMLSSANECAYAVAEHVGGTVDHFVEMMNEKAAELGCTNTHFVNPHGLFDENHYTSAHDMALIAKAAYENETFRIITGTARYTIPPTNKHDEQTDLQNHNEMLYPWQTLKYRYEYCTGGKTGYTNVARSTLVTYAEKDGMSLVCVVMQTESPNQWIDSTDLFNYAFDNFQMFNIADNETRYDTSEAVEVGALNNNKAFVDIDRDAVIVLPKTTEFSDATSQIVYDDIDQSVVGSITYTYAGREVGRADIIKTGVEIEGFVFDNEKDMELETEEQEKSTVRIKPLTIILIVLGIVAAVVLGFAIKVVADNYYIIRHNMEVKKSRREQFKKVKTKNRHRRRRRR